MLSSLTEGKETDTNNGFEYFGLLADPLAYRLCEKKAGKYKKLVDDIFKTSYDKLCSSCSGMWYETQLKPVRSFWYGFSSNTGNLLSTKHEDFYWLQGSFSYRSGCTLGAGRNTNLNCPDSVILQRIYRTIQRIPNICSSNGQGKTLDIVWVYPPLPFDNYNNEILGIILKSSSVIRSVRIFCCEEQSYKDALIAAGAIVEGNMLANIRLCKNSLPVFREIYDYSIVWQGALFLGHETWQPKDITDKKVVRLEGVYFTDANLHIEMAIRSKLPANTRVLPRNERMRYPNFHTCSLYIFRMLTWTECLPWLHLFTSHRFTLHCFDSDIYPKTASFLEAWIGSDSDCVLLGHNGFGETICLYVDESEKSICAQLLRTSAELARLGSMLQNVVSIPEGTKSKTKYMNDVSTGLMLCESPGKEHGQFLEKLKSRLTASFTKTSRSGATKRSEISLQQRMDEIRNSKETSIKRKRKNSKILVLETLSKNNALPQEINSNATQLAFAKGTLQSLNALLKSLGAEQKISSNSMKDDFRVATSKNVQIPQVKRARLNGSINSHYLKNKNQRTQTRKRGEHMVASSVDSHRRKNYALISRPSPDVLADSQANIKFSLASLLELYDKTTGELCPRNGWDKTKIVVGQKLHQEMKLPQSFDKSKKSWRDMFKFYSQMSFEKCLRQERISLGIDYGDSRGLEFEKRFAEMVTRSQEVDLESHADLSSSRRLNSRKFLQQNGTCLPDLVFTQRSNNDKACVSKSNHSRPNVFSDVQGMEEKEKHHIKPEEMKKRNLKTLRQLVKTELAKPNCRKMLFSGTKPTTSEEDLLISSVKSLAMVILEGCYSIELGTKALQEVEILDKVAETCLFAIKMKGGV